MDFSTYRFLSLTALVSLFAACASGSTPEILDDDGRLPSTGVGGGTSSSGSSAGGAQTTDTASSSSGMGGASTSTGMMATSTSTGMMATSTSATTSTTTGGCTAVDLLNDGGFEQGPGGPWVETSTNFGTPICDASCVNMGTQGPRSGAYWAWFGGIGGTLEQASVTQTVVIGAGGMASLDFYLQMPECDGPGDFFEVRVDGNLEFSRNGGDASCGSTTWQLHSINLASYADGGSHSIQFFGDTLSFTTVTNFMVDDAQLIACP